MMDSGILSPGEKIKRLRTELNLTQEDIIDETISKSLISMIEQNKRGLTERAAEIIANRLNEHYEKISGRRPVTAAYLMETEEEQMKREIDNNIESLKRAIKLGQVDEHMIILTFDRTLCLINQGGFKEEKIEIRILRGDYYYDNFKYKLAVNDYLDALDYAIEANNYGQIARIYILLGTTYQMQLGIDNALVHYNKAYQMANFHDTENKDKIKVQAVFNEILCYRSIRRYELALSKIALFRHLKLNDPLYRITSKKVDLIEANIYREFKNWEKAENIYQKLLAEKKKLDNEMLFLVYENYGVFYREKGDNQKALEYLGKALQLREKIDLFYIPPLYLYQSTCYNLEEEYEKVIVLLENALSLAEMISRREKVIEVRFAFVEIFLELEYFELALKHLSQVDELVHQVNIKPILHDLYSYYIECYKGLGMLDKISEYATKIRQKNYYRDIL